MGPFAQRKGGYRYIPQGWGKGVMEISWKNWVFDNEGQLFM